MKPSGRLWPFLAAAWLASCLFDGERAAGTGSSTETGIVTGRILSEEGKTPVAGAAVSLLPVDYIPPIGSARLPEVKTDSAGYYRFERVSPGRYNVLAGKDSLRSFRDSLRVDSAGAKAGADTLQATGSQSGIVRLRPGDDPRTVLIFVIGTSVYAVPRDTSGAFTVGGLAEGQYTVRLVSTIDAYAPMEFIMRIRSGQHNTLPQSPIEMPYRGVPVVQGLQAAWDPLLQVVRLDWKSADTAIVAGYNVYRAVQGTPFGSMPLNSALIREPSFRDTSASFGSGYAYAVKAVDKSGNLGALFSNTQTVTPWEAYTLDRRFRIPAGARDQTPLAVSRGEIFWLSSRDTLDVYDTVGAKLRSFGFEGPGAIRNGCMIKILRDTVYVVEHLGDPGTVSNLEARLKRFSRQGAFIDSQDLGRFFHADLVLGAGDIWKSAEGVLFATNAKSIYAYRPDGARDSAPSPITTPIFRGIQKIEPLGEHILLMNGLSADRITGQTTFQTALLRQSDLSTVRFDSASSRSFSGYATDGKGKIWIIRDNTLAEALSSGGTVLQRVGVPRLSYLDITVDEGENLYLFNAGANEILFYRKR